MRDGKAHKVTALVSERGETETANATDISHGLEGADLADAPDGGGVLVRSVQDGSPAARRDSSERFDRRHGPNARLEYQVLPRSREGLNLLLLNVRRGSGDAPDPDPLMP